MKYLLFAVIAYLLWRFWKKRNETPPEPPAPEDPAPEQMLRCAHCGVHMPASDALVEEGIAYCSEAHRQAGRTSPRE